MKPRSQLVWAVIAGLGAGLALGALLMDAPTPPASPAGAAPASGELDGLRRDLARARQERDALAAQIESLQQLASEAPETQPPELGDTPEAQAKTAGDSGEPVAFDEAWLGEIGYSESEIEKLRALWDQIELDRLYLADLAKRESWHQSPRYRERLRQLHDQLRDEQGDDRYDVLLYAAGRGNRVLVSDVLADSPAVLAGFEDGDVIRSYAGRRLFNVADLIQITSSGEPGRPTEVRVERGGHEIRIFVPRGPLGVRVRRVRRVPDTLR